ncbi:MAG: AbrB/MazE/SpoVT family DNA-binding domain-containing protein [Verrucomicrobiales bacterium]|nr:AbrB/MazE/SpoVT family DNA-binding domain-containing protein [Verrucomicrobiales bacterium]
MSDTISIDQAGRMVLPKPIRDRLRLSGGSKLLVEMVGDHLELRPVETENSASLVEKDGLLVVASTDSTFDVVQAMDGDRNDREDHLCRS